MTGTAHFSADGIYRYRLTRTWNPAGWRRALFIMLNPSTADANRNDRTIGRCITFAQREHCHGLVVVNLYAYRAAKPATMFAAQAAGTSIIGPDNDHVIVETLAEATRTNSPIIAAWGAGATNPHRVYQIKHLLKLTRRAYCLGTTLAGAPRHPLYVPADTPLQPFPTTKSHQVPTKSPIQRDLVK